MCDYRFIIDFLKNVEKFEWKQNLWNEEKIYLYNCDVFRNWYNRGKENLEEFKLR